MFISDSASDVTKEDRYRWYRFRGRRRNVKFSVCFSLSIHGVYEAKSRIHESSNGDTSICFSVKENSEMAQEQEHSFMGNISLAECNALLAL